MSNFFDILMSSGIMEQIANVDTFSLMNSTGPLPEPITNMTNSLTNLFISFHTNNTGPRINENNSEDPMSSDEDRLNNILPQLLINNEQAINTINSLGSILFSSYTNRNPGPWSGNENNSEDDDEKNNFPEVEMGNEEDIGSDNIINSLNNMLFSGLYHNGSSIQFNHNRQPARFGLSRYLSTERILNSRRYEENDYETAEIIFFELRDEWKQLNNITETFVIDTHRNVNIALKNMLLDFYNNGNSDDERFPNLQEFIEKIISSKCICLGDYNEEHVKKLLEYYCMFYGRYPHCNEVPYILEFYLIQKRFPKEDELEDHIYRSIQFNLNPEEYHQNDKEFVPTVGIDKLPIFKYNENDPLYKEIQQYEIKTCAICQEDFSENQNVIKLTPCNHLFHSTNSDCLENASIRNWLEKYNHCPLCKQKIKVN